MTVKYKINKSVITLLTIMVMIFAKLIKVFVLNSSFFYDSNLLLEIMNGEMIVDNPNYNYGFASNVFNAVNLFSINNVVIFDYVFGIVFTFLLVLFDNKILGGYYSIFELLFLLLVTFLLNVYTFSLSKDLIQFVLYFLYVAIVMKIKNKSIALFFSLIPIGIIAYYLRNYFAAVMGLYILFAYFLPRQKKYQRVFGYMALGVFSLLFAIYVLQSISPEIYNKIVTSNEINSYREANSKIRNVLSNSNFINFAINYVINFFRMLLPIELLTKGLYYFVFVFYQFILLFLLFRKLKQSFKNKTFIMLFAMALSYFMICVLFEPDFGSFLRHQISIIIVYIPMLFYDWNGKKNELYFEFCYNKF